MSLHFSLAKKLIAHAKDLIRHIFNEAGHDAQALEKKFLEALKSHAADELQKVENKVGDSLQHWERAPDAANMTSPYASPALPEEEESEEEKSEEKPEDATPAPSATPSDKDAASETAAGEDIGEKDGEGEKDKSADDIQPKEATPPDTSVLPEEGAASVHGEPWPSSAIESQDAADAGKDLGAASELDLPKEEEKGEEDKGEEPVAAPSLDPPKEATEAAGEDKAAEQASAPAIADGTVKVPGEEVDEDKKEN